MCSFTCKQCFINVYMSQWALLDWNSNLLTLWRNLCIARCEVQICYNTTYICWPIAAFFFFSLPVVSVDQYRVIHRSLRDFRPLRYSSRDGHAEGEHVNRGRDTPSFCPTLQVLDMLTSEGSWQTFLAHARESRPMAPAGLFVSQRTGSQSAGISCTTHELFCP